MTLDRRPPEVGPNLKLRLVELHDAEYIQRLRTDPTYNRFLSCVDGTVEDQRTWLREYMSREARGQELYYVIERRSDAVPCGVVRLYDIGAGAFTWGSWILDSNKPRKAALESALLSFGVGFDSLMLERAHVDVRLKNEKAINLYVRFGMSEVRRDEENIYYEFSSARYRSQLAHWSRELGWNGSERMR